MRKRKNTKKNPIIQMYKDCWNYLIESKEYIWLACFLMGFFAIIGFIAPVFFVDFLKEYIKNILAKTSGFGFFGFLGFIFMNNLTASFVSLLFGFFLGLFPIFTLIFNGYVLGFVARASSDVYGWFSLWRLFPHGIFELPAIIIATALGIKLGMAGFSGAKSIKKEILFRLIKGLKVFFMIIIPLLIIAAIIESMMIVLLR